MRRQIIIKIISIVWLVVALTTCTSVQSSNGSSTSSSFKWAYLIHPSWRHNLWPAMASNFKLTTNQNIDNALVQKLIRHYKKHPHTIKQLTANAKPYVYYIYQQTEQRKMPAEIALLPMVESNYNPFLFSKRGAVGLWQMMPGTASGFNITINWWYDGRRDIVASTKAALDYLNYLHDFFGDWLLAAAAYDSGEGTVQAAIRHNKRANKPTDFWSLPLPAETKRYVPKMLALAQIISHPQLYKVTLTKVPNQPYFDAVPMQGQINLSLIAKLATTSTTAIRKLNPGFRRWATAPNMDYSLLLPANKAGAFAANLSDVKDNRVTWLHYKVQLNDTLGGIARKFNTKITILKRVNSLASNLIKVQQTLLIPQTGNTHFRIPKQRTNSSISEDHIPGPKRLVHIIAKSDTLWDIAASYHVKSSEIRFWNGLAYHQKLSPGNKLIIWKEPTYKLHSPVHYTVRSGDSISELAKRFATTRSTIMQANQLTTAHIRIGQKLIIPPNQVTNTVYKPQFKNQMITHPVQAGESLSTIAHDYGITTKQLASWNQLNVNKPIHINQLLRIYHTQ